MPLNNKSSINILIIQFRPAGDVLLLTPVVKAIKKRFPNSKITFMANEKEVILVENFKLIDSLFVIKKLPKNTIIDHLNYLKYNLSLFFQVRKDKYNVVIDFIGNPKSALITLLSGSPVRIGRKGKRSFAYNKKIDIKTKNVNTVIRRLMHLSPLGIKPEYISTELVLNKSDVLFAKKYLKSLNIKSKIPVIFLAPNSPRSSRKWKSEFFVSVGKALIKKYNAKILLGWGPGEEEYTRFITEGIGNNAIMIPPTSLMEMSAIIAQTDLIITNDTGAKHFANALGLRSITIYGPTNPYVWNDIDIKRNPFLRADIPCIQCEKRVCPLEKHLCMEQVTPDMVIKIADNILKKKSLH